MRRFFHFTSFFLFSCFMLRVHGADADPGPAEAMAQTWVHEIDSGAYSTSYDQGAAVFQQRISASKWTLILKTIRQPLGNATSRKLVSHNYYAEGYEGAEGQFMALIYETTFEKTGPYLENIVLKSENGRWKPAGYTAEPKAAMTNP